MRIKLLLLLVPVLSAPLLTAAGFSIQGLKVPMYDAAGQLSRTLTAASVEGPTERPVLKSGMIEFHTAAGEAIGPGSRLSFEAAVYDQAGGFIEGTGPVRLSSPNADLSGVDFHYELATGQLKLRRDVLLEPKDVKYQGAKIRGESADAIVRQNPADRSWSLGDTLIAGPVVATDLTVQETRFDRVETDRVTYSAADGTIVPAAPVTAWSKGEKIVLGAKSLQYQLDPAPPSPAPAAQEKAP